MSEKACPDSEFIELFRNIGPTKLAKKLGVDSRNIYERRRNIEKHLHIILQSPNDAVNCGNLYKEIPEHSARLQDTVKNGVVLVGSDSHYWPGVESVAHRAFVKFCKDIKPVIIVKNGDELDFPSISRFAPIGWENRPKVADEIECTKDRLSEIEDASKNSRLYWPLGNHDARFETRLATVAPEYARVNGVHLKDNFPRWRPCWSVWINDNVVIKHRFKGGIHAAHNNTMWAGKTIITGHLHSLKVTPFSDYNGTRWGVDTGTMADPYGPQFTDYTEDSPKSWRSGFIVLTFKNSELLWPEVCFVRDHKKSICEFRGETFVV